MLYGIYGSTVEMPSGRSLDYTTRPSDNLNQMLWFFERAGKHLQCEIRPASDGSGFEVAWIQDGETRLEHFESSDEAEQRRRAIEEKLIEDGWKRVGRVTPPTRKK
jgi:hypothetical protein